MKFGNFSCQNIRFGEKTQFFLQNHSFLLNDTECTKLNMQYDAISLVLCVYIESCVFRWQSSTISNAKNVNTSTSIIKAKAFSVNWKKKKQDCMKLMKWILRMSYIALHILQSFSCFRFKIPNESECECVCIKFNCYRKSLEPFLTKVSYNVEINLLTNIYQIHIHTRTRIHTERKTNYVRTRIAHHIHMNAHIQTTSSTAKLTLNFIERIQCSFPFFFPTILCLFICVCVSLNLILKLNVY